MLCRGNRLLVVSSSPNVKRRSVATTAFLGCSCQGQVALTSVGRNLWCKPDHRVQMSQVSCRSPIRDASQMCCLVQPSSDCEAFAAVLLNVLVPAPCYVSDPRTPGRAVTLASAKFQLVPFKFPFFVCADELWRPYNGAHTVRRGRWISAIWSYWH